MRILIVKLSSLGDVVQTLPVLHDLRTQVPGARIDWVVEEAFAGLLREVPTLERVLPYAERRWRRQPWRSGVRRERAAFVATLREVAYDAVIDCQGLLKSAHVARRAVLAPGGFTAGFGNRSEACAYEWPVRYLVKRPLPMPRRIHAVARTRLLASLALGYTLADGDAPVYPWTAETATQPGTVLLAHGTTRADNEWPEAAWLALGRLLVAAGHRVLLPHASPREEQLATRLVHGIGPGAELLPRMGLAALLGRLRDCSGLIGVDSGVSHLGVALGLPVVEIFSQPRAWRAGPVGQPHQCAVGGDAAPSADAVWQAWQGAWAARPLPAHASKVQANVDTAA